MSNPTIKLKSNDGVVYEVDLKVAESSQTIETMMEDLGMDDCDVPIPLPNVNSAIMEKVIEWSTYHKDDPPYVGDSHIDISEWDAAFLNVDHDTLFELIYVANYLHIPKLLDLGCKAVAKMIQGKTVDEIRQTFKSKSDVTSAEEKQVRKENDSCDDK